MKSVQKPRVKYNKNPILPRKNKMTSVSESRGALPPKFDEPLDPKTMGPKKPGDMLEGISGKKFKEGVEALLHKANNDAVDQGGADQAHNWAKPKV
jgi:hypothetical protein